MNRTKARSTYGKSPFIYMDYVSNVLNEMRHKRELTDLVLVTEDTEFPVHWVVMAAGSSHFKHLNEENRLRWQRMLFPNVKAYTMNILLDFLYTGDLKLPLSMQGVEELLKAAYELEMDNFSKHVEAELIARITSETYISLWELCDKLEGNELQEHLENFVALSIEELRHSPSQFGRLQSNWLLKVCMLSSASPTVQSESVVQAILTWINCDPTNRVCELSQFLPYLHLADCRENFLRDLWHNEILVHKFRPFKRELYNAIISMRHDREIQLSFSNPAIPLKPTKTRKRENRSMHTFPSSAFCKDKKQHGTHQPSRKNDKSESKEMVCAQNKKKACKMVKEMPLQPRINQGHDSCPTWRREPSMPTSPKALVVILGWQKNGDLAMRSLNPDEALWIPSSPVVPALSLLPIPHNKTTYRELRLLEGAASTSHASILYLAGGLINPRKDRKPCASVLAFDACVSMLMELYPMPSPRALAGAGVLGGNLYVVGGTGFRGKPTNAVERYSILKKEWQIMHPMPLPCWEMGVASSCGRLFTCGGRCRGEWTQACYSYNPEINQWFRIDALPLQEFDNTYPVVAAAENCIYAFRHQNATKNARLCCFHLPESKWMLFQTTKGVGSRKILSVLPWKDKIWVVDEAAKLFCYDLSTHIWSSPVSFVKCLPKPIYAALLTITTITY